MFVPFFFLQDADLEVRIFRRLRCPVKQIACAQVWPCVESWLLWPLCRRSHGKVSLASLLLKRVLQVVVCPLGCCGRWWDRRRPCGCVVSGRPSAARSLEQGPCRQATWRWVTCRVMDGLVMTPEIFLVGLGDGRAMLRAPVVGRPPAAIVGGDSGQSCVCAIRSPCTVFFCVWFQGW